MSITPYAHPIMPLLLDFESTHEAMPEAPLPHARAYPGVAGELLPVRVERMGDEGLLAHVEQIAER